MYKVIVENNRCRIEDEKGKLICYVQNEIVANDLITFWKKLGI